MTAGLIDAVAAKKPEVANSVRPAHGSGAARWNIGRGEYSQGPGDTLDAVKYPGIVEVQECGAAIDPCPFAGGRAELPKVAQVADILQGIGTVAPE